MLQRNEIVVICHGWPDHTPDLDLDGASGDRRLRDQAAGWGPVASKLVARAKQTIARRQAAKQTATGDHVVASNRRARHDFELIETFECGIVLQGSEVKSLREGKAQIAEAYARVLDGELWLYGCTSRLGSRPGLRGARPGSTAQAAGAPGADRRAAGPHPPGLDLGAGVALLPRRPGQSGAGPGQGRKLYDKRQAIAARDAEREAARATRASSRWKPERRARRYRISQRAGRNALRPPWPAEARGAVGRAQGVNGLDFGCRGGRSEPWSPEPR